jgi:hypothetical protein
MKVFVTASPSKFKMELREIGCDIVDQHHMISVEFWAFVYMVVNLKVP